MLLLQLQEKRGELLTQARSAFDEITKNTDDARASELEARHDTIMAELDALDAKIQRAQRLEQMEKDQEERMRQRQDRNEQRRPNNDGSGLGDESRDTDRQALYRMAFAKALCGSIDDLEPEERAILRTGFVKANEAESRAQSTSSTAGGYTVPTELMPMLVKTMLAWGPMYDPGITSEIVTASGNAIKIPTVDDTTVPAVAHTENTALTDDGGSDVTFGQKSLDAYAYDTEFVRWSWELTQDSIFNMESLLADLLGERLGRIANDKLTTGDGSSKPHGIVHAATTGKTAASTTAFTAEEILDLQHSVDPAYRGSPKARFMMHDLILAFCRKIKDGNGNFIWSMGDITTGAPERLLGYRYSVNQAMDSALTTGKQLMLFGDFGKYYVRKVGAPVIGVMRERFWPDNGIAGLIRFDGELADTTAVKRLVLA